MEWTSYPALHAAASVPDMEDDLAVSRWASQWARDSRVGALRLPMEAGAQES